MPTRFLFKISHPSQAMDSGTIFFTKPGVPKAILFPPLHERLDTRISALLNPLVTIS